MPFLCPACSTPRALQIKKTLELPADSRSDEITLQIVKCSHCGFAGIAVYEESRRGSLDGESVDHTGYRVPAEELRALKAALKHCPEPRNRRCQCQIHQTFGRKRPSGRWGGLDDFNLEEPFRMTF